MLLCHPHHRLIDQEKREEHPEDLLVAMKAAHEARIARVTAIGPELKSQILVLRTPIGDARPPSEIGAMRRAVLAAGRYPVSEEIVLEVVGAPPTERRDDFWEKSRRDLDEFYGQRVHWRLSQAEPHFSVFGLAPIPLLIAFGKLLGDKTPAHVYQRSREPAGWEWPDHGERLDYEIVAEKKLGDVHDVGLVLSVSDAVQRPDVEAVLPAGAPVYELRIAVPRRDCVRSPEDVSRFLAEWQRLLGRVRDWHQAHAPRLHLFPALPNSLAIALGRGVLQKAHSRLSIYDLNRDLGGFRFAFDL